MRLTLVRLSDHSNRQLASMIDSRSKRVEAVFASSAAVEFKRRGQVFYAGLWRAFRLGGHSANAKATCKKLSGTHDHLGKTSTRTGNFCYSNQFALTLQRFEL